MKNWFKKKPQIMAADVAFGLVRLASLKAKQDAMLLVPVRPKSVPFETLCKELWQLNAAAIECAVHWALLTVADGKLASEVCGWYFNLLIELATDAEAASERVPSGTLTASSFAKFRIGKVLGEYRRERQPEWELLLAFGASQWGLTELDSRRASYGTVWKRQVMLKDRSLSKSIGRQFADYLGLADLGEVVDMGAETWKSTFDIAVDTMKGCTVRSEFGDWYERETTAATR